MENIRYYLKRVLSLIVTVLMIPISIIAGLFTLGLVAIGSVIGLFWVSRRLKRAEQERRGIVIDHQD